MVVGVQVCKKWILGGPRVALQTTPPEKKWSRDDRDSEGRKFVFITHLFTVPQGVKHPCLICILAPSPYLTPLALHRPTSSSSSLSSQEIWTKCTVVTTRHRSARPPCTFIEHLVIDVLTSIAHTSSAEGTISIGAVPSPFLSVS